MPSIILVELFFSGEAQAHAFRPQPPENGSAVEIKVKDYNKLNEFNVGDTAIVSYKKGYFGFEHYAGAPRNKKNIPQGLILKD